ncbi:serine/threonine-protein kinase [Kribbella sp. NPDC051770]|uniref:serine/threonine-protein kinase n=1 Tax=Kribbella sp. NPDC051770 TaxID=3155413 RepID=UPI003448F10F
MSGTGGQPSAPLEVEERIGPYRLIRRLGQGGMGVVYLAEGPQKREVALKVLRSHVAHDPTARARLEREATTLRRIDHPGVAGVLDYDLQGDRPYLVTRFIPGRPLDEQVDDRGPLTPQRWLPLAGCLAESLQAIHAAGVIHRDLKPGNVMMFNGKPVMIDFGIAQAADDLRLTQTGLVIGTPGYLAPELIEGEMVSESADWWGWAATAAYAATGRRPFGKGPFEVVLSRVHSGQADLEGLDPRLKPLLAAALSPDRRNRPTQIEIMAGLNRYAEGRDALVPAAEEKTVLTAPETIQLHPPTTVMSAAEAGTQVLGDGTQMLADGTRVLPDGTQVRADGTQLLPDGTRVMPDGTRLMPGEDPSDPAAVAQLVPAVIPPLSAFAPLRDKLRDVAAEQKAARLAAKAAAVPVHPATYSPVPGAAAPAAMPLPYQSAPGGLGGPATGPNYAPPSNYPVPQQQHQPVQKQNRALEQRPSGPPLPPASRGGLLFALLLALAALIAVLPVLGMLVAAALTVLARMVDKSSTALLRRREARGYRGKSDGLVAVAASPVHLTSAALVSLPAALLPLIVGFTVGGITTLVIAMGKGFEWPLLAPISIAIGAVFGLMSAWGGPGGSSLRHGARAGLRTVFRPAWLSGLVTVALLVVTGVLALRGYQSGTNWTPLANAFELPQLPSPTLGDLRQLPVIRDLPFIN